jgi:hypothetical protein
MTEDRVDPFANISLGNFKPKSDMQRPADTEVIEKISKDNNFPSRAPQEAKPSKRARFNSGVPKKQLNIKVTEACYDRFYEMAESRGIRVLGDLMTMALDALENVEPQDKH